MKEVELSPDLQSRSGEPTVFLENGEPVLVMYPVKGIPRRDLEMILGILQRRMEPGWNPDY